MDITYKKQVNFIGRNGMFKQSGIAIDLVEREFKDKTTSTIELQPFTNLGIIGRAMLEIPSEDVPSVIVALQKVANVPLDPIETLQANYEAMKSKLTEAKQLISELIEFGEDCVVGDESETITSFKEREAAL